MIVLVVAVFLMVTILRALLVAGGLFLGTVIAEVDYTADLIVGAAVAITLACMALNFTVDLKVDRRRSSW